MRNLYRPAVSVNDVNTKQLPLTIKKVDVTFEVTIIDIYDPSSMI